MQSCKLIPVLALAVTAPVALAQAKGRVTGGAAGTAAVPPARSAALASGARINAVLKSKLDTRHAKVGDRVTGRTTAAVKQGGTVVLPKGSTLYGRVTQVSPAADSKSRASLGVLFDQAVTPKGQRIPMHAAITGLAAAGSRARFDGDGAGFGAGGAGMMAAPMAPMAGAPGMAEGGGGLLGGVGGGAGAVVGGGLGAVAPLGEATAGLGAMGSGALTGAGASTAGGMLRASHGALFSASNGALFSIEPLGASGTSSAGAAAAGGARTGMPGALGARGAGSAGTLLTSKGGNLRFDSGSHMQLQESGPGGVGAGAGGGARTSAHAGAGGGR